MSELHTLSTPDALPYYSFYHNDVEYVIWLWAEDTELKSMYAINLSPVIFNGGTYKPGGAVATMSGLDKIVEMQGGFEYAIKGKFVDRVNKYLATQVGGPTTFPETGENWDKFIFLVKNNFKYINGQIAII